MLYSIYKTVIKRSSICFMILMLTCLLTGCKEETVTGTPVVMSYISYDHSKMIAQTTYLETDSLEEQVKEVLQFLAAPSEKLEYQVPLSQGITLKDYQIVQNSLTLNLSEEYGQLSAEQEILARASLVKSLTAIEGIDKVSIFVADSPLVDSLGKNVGSMTADMFIDNAGEEINMYDKITVRLYFANEAGDGLIAVDRSKAYNTNISLDKFVVEELIKGPETTTEGVQPTMNPETKLISTFVKDNICYVNLDSTFAKQVNEVQADVVIYSIVNSLCELSGIDRVQIFIDGKSEVVFRELIPLTTVFSRDLKYTQTASK